MTAFPSPPPSSCPLCVKLPSSSPQQFTVLPDDKPRGKQHVLVVPTTHISLPTLLSHPDAHSHLTSAALLGLDAIQASIDDNDIILGFHPPPFNSVWHAHLHVIQTPMVSSVDALRFATNPWGLGFVSLSQVLSCLQQQPPPYP